MVPAGYPVGRKSLIPGEGSVISLEVVGFSSRIKWDMEGCWSLFPWLTQKPIQLVLHQIEVLPGIVEGGIIILFLFPFQPWTSALSEQLMSRTVFHNTSTPVYKFFSSRLHFRQ
jgi:hypothetical protein